MAGVHDDQVDALGLIRRILDKMSRGIEPKQPELPKTITINAPGALPVTRVNLGVTLDDLWRDQER